MSPTFDNCRQFEVTNITIFIKTAAFNMLFVLNGIRRKYILSPTEIECLPTGWSHESASCDATNGGLTPGAQMALIIVGLLLLCGATFLWQRYRKKDPNSKS